MQLTDKSRLAWAEFLSNTENKGHATRSQTGISLETHVEACWNSAQQTAQRIHEEIRPFSPKNILEIGSSTGLNCYALAQTFPDATVYGVEPEIEAVTTAQSMAESFSSRPPIFVRGFGESLSFGDETIDLIVCHTVIEHVNNVQDLIRESSRVLSLGGFFHLEAPNYNWPYEPHLNIWCIPRLGKKFVRLCGKWQDQTQNFEFLNHLQFVHPGGLEHLFTKNGLTWHNRVRDKIRRAAGGDEKAVLLYHGPRKILAAFHRWGLLRLAEEIIIRSGLYPSVLYTLRKKDPP